MLFLYSFVLVLLGVYSYSLVDPNFTLINHTSWEVFRNVMVKLGYYQRPLNFSIFLVFILLLSFFNWYFLKKRTRPLKIALVTASLLLFSYPFLSHDFFNYLFDAKILTYYGKNPYLYRALDFPEDPWLRFMHWTHRTYSYGPSFLLLSLIPSYLSFGKLILAFFGFKMLFAGFYLAAVWALNKFSHQAAMFLATNPLVIIEGLVNNHNDFLGLSLALLAFYFWFKKKKLFLSSLLAIFSIGIKYATVAFIAVASKLKQRFYVALLLLVCFYLYVYLKIGIHPWYFLNLFVFLPFVKKNYFYMIVMSFGLLLSYYPYLLYGDWASSSQVASKEYVILITMVICLAGFFLQKLPYFSNKTASR
jgi:hypothetical protein